MKKVWLFHFVSFCSAFLLFQIELIVAKKLLPLYGGSYLVWGASLVFFQATLLAGYLYSHVVVQKIGIYRYRMIHLLLLLTPLLGFPGQTLTLTTWPQSWPLVLDVFRQLTVSIGVVFFVLSTMGLILQSWLSCSELPEYANPYVLYGASNLGSFLALASYPFFFEIVLDLDSQLKIWRFTYFIFILCVGVVLMAVRVNQKKPMATGLVTKISLRQGFVWLLYGAAGVILFLSVTNIVTTEIASIPLLWIFPLGIYLIAFVLNFKANPWCPRWIKKRVPILLAMGALLYFLLLQKKFPMIVQMVLIFGALFVLCMICQNQLYLRRPVHNKQLTAFYVIMSLGGFLGGIWVTWIMPLLASSHVEYLLGLVIISAAEALDRKSEKLTWGHVRLVVYCIVVLAAGSFIFYTSPFFGFIIIGLIWIGIFVGLSKNWKALTGTLVIILCAAPFIETLWTEGNLLWKKSGFHMVSRHRNYYGVYKIYDAHQIRYFYHGTTLHGAQFIDPAKQSEPLTYYAKSAPVGEVLTSPSFQFSSVGIVGLGVGTLAAYATESQEIDFFELDPDVHRMAKEYFTYLNHPKGAIHYFMGDARIALNKIPEKQYDLFIVDAFSGDAIPVHLITLEALEMIHSKIKEDGVVLFHISSNYFVLGPVLAKVAQTAGAHLCYKLGAPGKYSVESLWAAVTWDQAEFDKLIAAKGWALPEPNRIGDTRVWTDQYSSVLTIFKVRELIDSVRF
jgi:hypothetical protein